MRACVFVCVCVCACACACECVCACVFYLIRFVGVLWGLGLLGPRGNLGSGLLHAESLHVIQQWQV